MPLYNGMILLTVHLSLLILFGDSFFDDITVKFYAEILRINTLSYKLTRTRVRSMICMYGQVGEESSLV